MPGHKCPVDIANAIEVLTSMTFSQLSNNDEMKQLHKSNNRVFVIFALV